MNLVGRQEEQQTLKEFYDSKNPEFLAIYGRRRIGKTFLIRQYFSQKDCYFFNVTGIKDGAINTQINLFIKEIEKIFYKGTEIKQHKNWIDTLQALSDAIENFVPKNKNVVLFFDEFPWMATHKSKLLQSLEHRWNQSWSTDQRIKLIICGSSASWIINKVINNKGGLHNRITKKIHLMPFNLNETKSLLATKNINLSLKHTTEIYMVTGGVPYYLLQIEKGKSATQIIETLAFRKNSLLFNEFDNLFSSLFEDAEDYIKLIRIIAEAHSGIGQEDIIKRIEHQSRGGRIVKKLTDLEEAGFIISFIPYKHNQRGKYYRLIDEYTLFYLDWIEPIRNTLEKQSLEKGYWERKQGSQTWHAWAGYAFEAICYKHLSEIKKKLSIPITATANGWRYVPRKNASEKGAQIDLLFDREDDAINICEIKYTNEPFSINKDYAEKLKNKVAVFKERTRTKKNIFLSVISANGLKENMYAEEMITNIVILDDLFE